MQKPSQHEGADCRTDQANVVHWQIGNANMPAISVAVGIRTLGLYSTPIDVKHINCHYFFIRNVSVAIGKGIKMLFVVFFVSSYVIYG